MVIQLPSLKARTSQMTYRNILCLSAHTDDSELGAGASIAKWRYYGSNVLLVSFSATEDRKLLIAEQENAASMLNIQPYNLKVLSYEVRKFQGHRQEILDTMISIGNEYKPDLVLCPSSQDSHQDHTTVHKEAVRAFRGVSMLGYECPWNNRSFSTDVFSVIQEAHMQRKVDALACYRSQVEKPYMKEEYTRSLALVHGATIKKRYAESFEAIRIVI